MPSFQPTMVDRNSIFQVLKPPCVQLSEAALALSGPKGNIQVTTSRLRDLKQTLDTVSSNSSSLDGKLADYVFFPISHILKLSTKISIECLELSLECIAVLIERGWRQRIEPQLAAQMVILCTLIAEAKPKGFTFTETTDELQIAALRCLQYTFESSGASVEARQLLNTDKNFPQLGQCISVMLDDIQHGRSAEVQVAASRALSALVEQIADRELSASFLPGIASKLTKILAPSTQQRRNHSVLIISLGILTTLLQRTLSDDISKNSGLSLQKKSVSVIDKTWTENAAEQLRLALQSILRLKSHSRSDVRDALVMLCSTLLSHCSTKLSSSVPLVLETLMAISAEHNDRLASAQIRSLVLSNASFTRVIQSAVYDWLQSLPTIMQSADDQLKIQKVGLISTAYQLLIDVDTDVATLRRTMANILRDSVVVTLQSSPRLPIQPISGLQSLDINEAALAKGNMEYDTALVERKGQQQILAAIEGLAVLSCEHDESLTFSRALCRAVRSSHGETQIANFWLLLTSLAKTFPTHDLVDEVVDMGSKTSSDRLELLEDAYSIALSILIDQHEADSRLQSLALRTLSVRAQAAGREFRFELVDALYPVLHTLATPDERLQRDSVTTLNLIAQACVYPSVDALIVENVDYLTNAIALKLNAFDISPQAPQVLLMMVRLAGPSLLPYLEDTVDSIFAALEDFHGYPLLVELLFKVLGVMAEEGTKIPQLAIEADQTQRDTILNESWKPTTMDQLVGMIGMRTPQELPVRSLTTEPHPQRPWAGIEDTATNRSEVEQEEESGGTPIPSDVEVPPPAPKTYNLLFKITELTQHFLPTASLSLRTSLLRLIKTTIPAIARHENSFLPLVNTLWPEVTSRLEDPEPSIQAAALDTVSALCEYAGDFMRSRITQLWPLLCEIHGRTARAESGAPKAFADTAKVLTSSKTKSLARAGSLQPTFGSDPTRTYQVNYNSTSVRMVRDALVSALVVICGHVKLTPDLFDDALEMLAPLLHVESYRSVLEKENADAVWLVRLRVGQISGPEFTPKLDGFVEAC